MANVHSLEKYIGAYFLTPTLTPTLDLLNPKSVGCDTVLRNYCAMFQVIPIRGTAQTPINISAYTHIHAYIHTYIHTYTHIHHDKLIAISAPPCYVSK